jgi:hypothetical protein
MGAGCGEDATLNNRPTTARLAECEDRSGRSNKPQQEGTAEPDREKLGRPRLNTRENTQWTNTMHTANSQAAYAITLNAIKDG